MNGQHGTRARILTCVVAGVAVAVTWAGAVAPARAAAQGMTTGVRPPGAGDASAIGAARPAGSWGRAIEVPGLGALNKSGDAEVLSVSCGSAGNCAAGGDYQAFSRHGPQHEFVVSERHGRWGRAIRVPGLGALNKGYAGVLSVSCASAGNCAAGGDYTDRRGYGQGFVVSQRHGVWGRAIEVPGLGALNTAGGAEVTAVSCASAGNCAAGGDYTDRRGNVQGFVASERDGVWGRAIEVPGLGALNVGGDAFVDFNSVSCGSAGNCAAGGEYDAFVASGQGFVVVERHGRWRRAIEMPGPGALNAGVSEVLSVSCGSAGNCAAGGDYTDRRGHGQGFVASERDGVWGQAIEVPGLGALNTAGGAEVTAVSCASAGNCAAGGATGPERRAGVRGQRAGRRLGPGDRGARPGGPEQGRGRQRQLGVVRLGGQLRRRRGLLEPPLRHAGVRGRRAARPLAHSDRGARPAGPEQGRERPGHLGVVRPGGHLRGRRVLPRPLLPLPGVRREPDRIRRARALHAPAQHPGQDNNHVRETTTSPPAARPRPRSGTTRRLPACRRPAALAARIKPSSETVTASARHVADPSARQFTRTRPAHSATLTASNPTSRAHNRRSAVRRPVRAIWPTEYGIGGTRYGRCRVPLTVRAETAEGFMLLWRRVPGAHGGVTAGY